MGGHYHPSAFFLRTMEPSTRRAVRNAIGIDPKAAQEAMQPPGKCLCSWPGCSQLIPPNFWACPQHWHLLPEKKRERISFSMMYGRGSAHLRDAANDATQWIKRCGHDAENLSRKKHPKKWKDHEPLQQ